MKYKLDWKKRLFVIMSLAMIIFIACIALQKHDFVTSASGQIIGKVIKVDKQKIDNDYYTSVLYIKEDASEHLILFKGIPSIHSLIPNKNYTIQFRHEKQSSDNVILAIYDGDGTLIQ